LIDLRTGIVQAVTSGLNPQQQFGADVISRIGYTQQNKSARRRLQRLVVEAFNEMIQTLTTIIGITAEQIYDVSVAGNTVMGHLLLALDADYLAQSPYIPTVQFYPAMTAAELGLLVHPLAAVRLLPNIGRFVGSDTTAVILAAGMDQSKKITLAIDIGTNGEIVLGNCRRLLATSTAAGPAFEGARLRCGMRATAGAIDRVTIRNGEVLLRTIGSALPRGICGSGIICLLGELLRVGLISETGQLQHENNAGKNPEQPDHQITARLQTIDQEPVFLLYQNSGTAVYLTQHDIREIQLAKSAIRTGIELLLLEYGIQIEAVERILLAGAFGNFLDREQAVRIGLLPTVAMEKIHFIGNAACAGAELALLSQEMRSRAEAIARNTRYVEIATHPQFQNQFMENMIFPVE